MCIRDSNNTGYKMARDGKWIVWMGMWTSTAAVSYTHLDVYKRQFPMCPRRMCIVSDVPVELVI